MACQGCAARRKALKRIVKTVLKGNNTVQVPGNDAITEPYLDRMMKRYGKKRSDTPVRR